MIAEPVHHRRAQAAQVDVAPGDVVGETVPAARAAEVGDPCGGDGGGREDVRRTQSASACPAGRHSEPSSRGRHEERVPRLVGVRACLIWQARTL